MTRFTWECMDERACDTCIVSGYLAEHPKTTDAQRREMVECASAEIGWQELSAEEVVVELQKDVSASMLPDGALTVSIRGVRQWKEQDCRRLARTKAQNNIIEGEYLNGEDI